MIHTRHIHEIRAVCLWITRLLALGLIVYGCYLISARLLFALLGSGDISLAYKSWTGNGSDHGVFRGLPIIGVGTFLAFAGPRLVRWIITVPELGCPRCGYPGSGTCPECGLDSRDDTDQQT